jgi:hypothetical protein
MTGDTLASITRGMGADLTTEQLADGSKVY